MTSSDRETPDRSCVQDFRPLKIAIVTRKFWPISGATEYAVSDLARAIKEKGHLPLLLTVRWERTWPAYFHFNEFSVHRINRSANAPWSSFRYLRSLQQKIAELRVDGIIVIGLGEEAWAVSKSFAGKIPYVVRVDNHLLGTSGGRPNLSSRQITSLKSAEAIFAESNWTANRLQLHPAVKSRHINVVPDGIKIDPEFKRSPTRKGTARIAISDAHPILMIQQTQPLVICGAPLNGDEGLLDLVIAWQHVLERNRKAKLWLIGEGPKSRLVWEEVVDRGLVHSIIMPGSFDDLDEVFQAADVYVHPLRSDQQCSFLDRAMAAGVCPVVTETAATRDRITSNENGLSLSSGNHRALAEAINHALDNQDLCDRLGRAASKTAAKAYDVENFVDQYLEVFAHPVTQPPVSSNND